MSRILASNFNLSQTIAFNGTSTLVSIPDNAAYSQPTTGALTISCWINPSVLSMLTQEGTGYVHFLSKLASSNNEWAFRMYQTGNSENRNNRISFYVFAAAGGAGDGTYFEDGILANEWIHVVATVDSSKNVKIYKNGLFRNSTTSSLTLADGSATVKIGAGASGASFFQGSIDDIRIFNKVLTNAEIADIYNKNATITSGLVGWWKMDEGSGITATDSSVTANNGTITSGSYITSMVKARNKLNDVSQNRSSTAAQAMNVFPKRLLSTTNKSLLLDGSTQYASIANSVQTGLNFGLADFMIGGWFKLKNNGAIQVLAGKWQGSGYALSNAGNIGWDILFRGDQANRQIQLRLSDGTNNVTSSTTANGVTFADGQWHFLAIYAARSSNASFYVDGQLLNTVDISTTSLTLTSTGAFVIGTREDATAGFLSGLMQNVFVYNFGVSGLPTIIIPILENIYYQNIFAPSGLISLWSFNNVAIDIQSSNTLTLTASPSYSTESPFGTRSQADTRSAA